MGTEAYSQEGWPPRDCSAQSSCSRPGSAGQGEGLFRRPEEALQDLRLPPPRNTAGGR